jgi:hypothetical protein
MKRLDIHLGVGVGTVHFGMYPRDVMVAIEEPQNGDDWLEGNLNSCLLYPDLKFEFDYCDSRGPTPSGRLDLIEVRPRNDVWLFDRPLGTWTKAEVLARLTAEGHFPQLHASGDVRVADPPVEISFDESGRICWFSMQASSSLMSFVPTSGTALADDIIAARHYGRTRCGIASHFSPSLRELAGEFGLSDDLAIYDEINFAAALRVVQLILHEDLAFSQEMMPMYHAVELAQRFLAYFGSEGTRYFTNGTYHEKPPVCLSPATTATFDTGVLIIGPKSSGCVWVEDED